MSSLLVPHYGAVAPRLIFPDLERAGERNALARASLRTVGITPQWRAERDCAISHGLRAHRSISPRIGLLVLPRVGIRWIVSATKLVRPVTAPDHDSASLWDGGDERPSSTQGLAFPLCVRLI
jgi:hypothetical protein